MKSPRGLFVAFMRHVREADIRAVTAESMCYALLCYRPQTGSVCPSGEKNCTKREEKVGATIVSRVTWYTIGVRTWYTLYSLEIFRFMSLPSDVENSAILKFR